MAKAALLTSSSPTSPLPAPDGDSPLISDPCPALEFGVFQRHTVAATSQDEHPGCDEFMATSAGLVYHDPAVKPAASVRMSLRHR